jgi:hypothetical protein
VVDYGLTDPSNANSARKTALSIATGSTSTMALTLDGSLGEYIRATGHLKIDLFGFVQVEGDLAVESRDTSVKLAAKPGKAAEVVAVDALTIGGSHLNVFVGVNGGTSDAIGLQLVDIDFGLAMLSSKSDPSRTWTALTASATTVGFVGFLDFLPTVRNLQVDLNQAGRDGDQVVDFKAQNLDILTGTGSHVTLKLDGSAGELLRAEGDVTLKLLDFALFDGRIGFEKYTPSSPLIVKNSNGSESSVQAESMMAITGTNITAFVGYADGGFDTSKTLTQQADHLYGFGVQGVDFGVLMTNAGGQSYTAVKARMDNARLYGIDPSIFELSADGLSFNYASANPSKGVIDYAKSFNGGLALGSAGHIVIDFNNQKMGVYAERATLAISDFLYFSGAIGFENVDYADRLKNSAGATVRGAKGFSIGGANITAFVGYADGGIDRTKTLAQQADHLYGFGVDNLSFGFLSLEDQSGISYDSLKAHADTVAVYGFNPNDFQLTVSGLDIEYNSASTPGKELDFTGDKHLSVATGATPIDLDFKGDRLGVFANDALLKISKFVYVRGAIGFQKGSFGDMVDSSGSTIRGLEGFTIGGDHIDVFVGFASDGIDGSKTFAEQASSLYGVGAEGISFGLMSVKSKAGTEYTALKAHADSVAIYGFNPNDFQLSATGIDIAVNNASNEQKTIDFAASFASTHGYSVRTGGTPVLLDMRNEVLSASVANATLRISEFVYISGSFAFEKGAEVELAANTFLGTIDHVKAEAMTIGASHVQAFVGVGGPYRTDTNGDGHITVADEINPAAMGLVVDDFSFGMGIYKAKTNLDAPLSNVVVGTKFTALRATANKIGLVGIGDAFKFSLDDVVVEVNSSSNKLFVADFTRGGKVAGLSVPTGDPASPVLLNYTNEIISATVGHAVAKVAGVLYLEGGFTFQKRIIDAVDFHIPGTAIRMSGDALVVAGLNVSAFAGIRGPYITDSNHNGSFADETPNTDAIGFAIADLDFALVMMSPSLAGQTASQVQFFGLTATAGYAGLVGTDPYLTLNAQDVVFQFNGAFAAGYPIPMVYADFSSIHTGDHTGLDIPIGSNTTAFNVNFDSNFLRVGMTANLGVFNLFTLHTHFDFSFTLPSTGSLIPTIDLSSLKN